MPRIGAPTTPAQLKESIGRDTSKWGRTRLQSHANQQLIQSFAAASLVWQMGKGRCLFEVRDQSQVFGPMEISLRWIEQATFRSHDFPLDEFRDIGQVKCLVQCHQAGLHFTQCALRIYCPHVALTR
jgi:hypothetical protein